MNDFFGGEPLMNFKVVKQIVEYARSQKKNTIKIPLYHDDQRLLLTDDIIEYLNKEMYNVVLSLTEEKKLMICCSTRRRKRLL
ncbi:MAG: hypothetical protein ACLSCV_07035 [Acutalibacteraceae bacterium]